MLIYSFDPKKNKRVLAGDFLIPENVFIRKVNSRHYMIREMGYGFSEDVIQQLIQLDCKYVFIYTKKNEYKFPFQELLNQPIKSYGSGEQRFLKVR